MSRSRPSIASALRTCNTPTIPSSLSPSPQYSNTPVTPFKVVNSIIGFILVLMIYLWLSIRVIYKSLRDKPMNINTDGSIINPNRYLKVSTARWARS